MHNSEFIRLFDKALQVKEKLNATFEPSSRDYHQQLLDGLVNEMAGFKNVNAVKVCMILENVQRVLEEA